MSSSRFRDHGNPLRIYHYDVWFWMLYKNTSCSSSFDSSKSFSHASKALSSASLAVASMVDCRWCTWTCDFQLLREVNLFWLCFLFPRWKYCYIHNIAVVQSCFSCVASSDLFWFWSRCCCSKCDFQRKKKLLIQKLLRDFRCVSNFQRSFCHR